MDEGTLNIIQIILLVLRNAAQVLQDLKEGKIDPDKVDLDKLRSDLIALPDLPEEE
jgi:hypothetical protein